MGASKSRQTLKPLLLTTDWNESHRKMGGSVFAYSHKSRRLLFPQPKTELD